MKITSDSVLLSFKVNKTNIPTLQIFNAKADDVLPRPESVYYSRILGRHYSWLRYSGCDTNNDNRIEKYDRYHNACRGRRRRLKHEEGLSRINTYSTKHSSVRIPQATRICQSTVTTYASLWNSFPCESWMHNAYGERAHGQKNSTRWKSEVWFALDGFTSDGQTRSASRPRQVHR